MKVCFIGLGSIGQRHLMNLSNICSQQNIPLEIHALRTGHAGLRPELGALLNKTFNDINRLDSNYDAIFITNPTNMHYVTLLQCQDKSSHFFIEKPVFNSANVNLAPLTRLSGKTVYVACPLRYTKVLAAAKEIIHMDHVLSVRAISSSYLPNWRIGTDYRNTYSAHRDQGGGVSIDLIHEWDYLTNLFGFPLNIKSFDTKLSSLDIDCEDVAIYIAKYPKMLLELHLDYFGRKAQRTLELICENGTYRIDLLNSIIYKDSTLLAQYDEQPNDKYLNELQHFLGICYKHYINNNNLQNALKVLTLIETHRGK